MMNELDMVRHIEVCNSVAFTKDINIVGAGATGSWVALMLSKLGFENIKVYDFDVVEGHNLPNQCFRHSDIGKNKALAIQDICADFGVEIEAYDTKVDKDSNLTGIVIVLTDTMSSRKEIWDSIKLKHRVDTLIETRMDYNNGRVYTVNPQDIASVRVYEETLYSDEDAEEASGPSACGASQTVVGTSVHIASLVIWRVINIVNAKKNPFGMLFDVENVINIEEEL